MPREAIPDPVEEKVGKKKSPPAVTIPIPGLINLSGMELDEQLMNHVFNHSITLVHNLVREIISA